MRRIVMFNQVSADGYFADDRGELGWVVPEPELDRSVASNLGGNGTILFGHRTYQMFESFWPHALDDSPTSPDPHAPDHRSPELRAIAQWINDADKLVFSRTRGEVTWRNSRLVRELDPGEIEALKEEPGGDIMIFGSGSIVSQLTERGLIDEYQFLVCPVLLGSGRTLMNDVRKTPKLELLEVRSYPSGNVMLRYAPRR
ncbi:MAG TPA: dihydrofolate reductase family protein [Longimicrobium sp.]|nr:dihydrofolate reductase family protein [Longimicrobium sp.]